MKTKQKHKKIIIVLLILIGCSLVALAGVQLGKKYTVEKTPSSVVISDNIITNEDDVTANQKDYEESDDEHIETESNDESIQQTSTSSNTIINVNSSSSADTNIEEVYATALFLKKRQAEDNVPFAVTNMFPGDAETNYYCVNVSYKDSVTVRFKTDIQPGYEKLAEVLKVRVRLITTDDTLYDGLMRDMPESLNHKLSASGETSKDLYYEITAYLETSVENEYMQKALKADFKWWVEETGNLVSPETGDDSNTTIFVVVMLISLCMILLLLKKQKKEEQYYGE